MIFFFWLLAYFMSSGLIHVVACDRIFFLLKAEQYFIICKGHVLFIHSSVDGHLDCVHLFAMVIVLLSKWVCKYLFETLLLTLWIYTHKWDCWMIW